MAVLRESFVRFVIFVVKSEIGKHRILLSTINHKAHKAHKVRTKTVKCDLKS